MENNARLTLKSLSPSLKTLATWLIITLMIGYAVSFAQIYDRTHFGLKETVLYYRGDDTVREESIHLPQTFRALLSVAHVHTLSQPFLFAFVGLIFAFSRRSEKFKSLLIAMGFLGSLISNATPWLIRYGSSHFVILFPLSQFLIFVSLVTMSFISLAELACRR